MGLSMKLFAIFGDPVAHSRSPLMHNLVFKSLGYDACYTRVHLKDGSRLRETFFKLGLSGANVTVPHKEAAFKACDEVRGFAQKIGVVNTLVNENGRLVGYNTDADGFMHAIREFGEMKRILVIGAGGTAKALAGKFKELRIETVVLNRSAPRLGYFKALGLECHTWDDMTIERYDLIVNTTSAGLEDENYPAPLELLQPLLKNAGCAADAIYGTVTPFLKLAADLGKPHKDGADMLLGQGVLASDYFTEHRFGLDDITSAMARSFAL